MSVCFGDFGFCSWCRSKTTGNTRNVADDCFACSFLVAPFLGQFRWFCGRDLKVLVPRFPFLLCQTRFPFPCYDRFSYVFAITIKRNSNEPTKNTKDESRAYLKASPSSGASNSETDMQKSGLFNNHCFAFVRIFYVVGIL